MMFLFVFSTWQIIWSREARFYELLSFLYLLNIYFLWKYFVINNNKYFYYFIITILIWLIFHPFFIWIVIVSLFLMIYKSYKSKIKIHTKKIFILLIILTIFLIIDLISRYITNGWTNITQPISQINWNLEFDFFNYIKFYLKNIYSQLWIIYFLIRKKYIEFLLFWLIFIINLIAISYWYMAHTRYMFHLYWIITFIWSLWIILFISFIIKEFKLKKLLIIIIIWLIIISIIKTYKLTIIPQRFYYIDFTSPKPNFKLAYEYLNNNYKDIKIVSWFPQLCFWYNLKNFKNCEYAINLNLIWDKKLIPILEKRKKDYYTNIEYIKSLNQLDNNKNYFFILDDLSIKNIINKELLNDIINNCTMIYKDIWNYETSSFIWIWSCNNKNK